MRKVLILLGGAAAIVLLLSLPLLGGTFGYPALTKVATEAVIFAIAASALNIVLGNAGLVSFGHAAYFGLGGYVVGILNFHFVNQSTFLSILPGTNELIVTLLIALVLGAIMGLFVGVISLRTRKAQFIIITLAFAQMMFYFFVSLSAYGGDDGIGLRRRNVLPLIDTASDPTFYYVCLAILALVLLVLLQLRRSRFGFVLAAIRQSERRVHAAGLTPFRFQLLAMTISGAITALAGALMANHLKFASPEMLSWVQSGDLMIMAILGGVGTVLGPVLGAIALVTMENVFVTWTNNWQIAVGLILLLVVLFTNGRGLVGALDRLVARKGS